MARKATGVTATPGNGGRDSNVEDTCFTKGFLSPIAPHTNPKRGARPSLCPPSASAAMLAAAFLCDAAAQNNFPLLLNRPVLITILYFGPNSI